MSNKKWDNEVAEFLFPKGLLIRFFLCLVLCFLVKGILTVIEYPAEKERKETLKTVKEGVQAAIDERRFSEADELLQTYLKKYESTEETEDIEFNILNASSRGCWKGYGEWKTELQDSFGECFVYFYYPSEGDALYASEDNETYYLVFSDTEFSSADKLIEACQDDPGLCYQLASVKLEKYDRYDSKGKMVFYCFKPVDKGDNIAFHFDFTYFFKDDTAEIRYLKYQFNDNTEPKKEADYRVSLERME